MDVLGKLLGYGVSGLGLALAILAYRLLAAEQRVATPRQIIINAIYTYMIFSLVLTGAGLTFELYKAYKLQEKPIAELPPGASDSLWYDVLKATRLKLFGNASPKEYNRGVLASGQIAETQIAIPAGGCRMYFAMAKPPAAIEVSVVSVFSTAISSPLGTEPHFAYGRICAPKASDVAQAMLTVKMVAGNGPFVAEAYEVPDGRTTP